MKDSDVKALVEKNDEQARTIETMIATLAQQEKTIEHLKTELEGYVARSAADSAEFNKVRFRTRDLANAARAIVALAEEHEKQGQPM